MNEELSAGAVEEKGAGGGVSQEKQALLPLPRGLLPLPPGSTSRRYEELRRIADVYGEGKLSPEERDELAALTLEEKGARDVLAKAEEYASAAVDAESPDPWLHVEERRHMLAVRVRGQMVGILAIVDEKDRGRMLHLLRSPLIANGGKLIEATAIVQTTGTLAGVNAQPFVEDLYRRIHARCVGQEGTLDALREKCEREAFNMLDALGLRDAAIVNTSISAIIGSPGKLLAEVKIVIGRTLGAEL